MKNAEWGMAPVQPPAFILHSTFCILHSPFLRRRLVTSEVRQPQLFARLVTRSPAMLGMFR